MRSPTLSVLLASATLLLLSGCNGEVTHYAECAGLTCAVGTCEAPDGVARCACDAFQQATDARCDAALASPVDTLNSDADGILKEATRLGFLTPLEGSLADERDTDLFALMTEKNRYYWLEARALPGSRIRVELINKGLGVMWTSGCLDESQPVRRPVAESFATAFYLRVSSPASCGGSARYEVSAQDLGPDDHAGPYFGAPTPLLPGPPQSGVTEFFQDADSFVFDATAGHIYRFACSGSPPELCGSLGVRPPQGDLFGMVWDAESVRFEAQVTGKHTVTVQSSNYERVGRYSYQLQDLGTDDHGDAASSATPIGVGTTAGIFELKTDVDAFRFQAEAGHLYELRCQQCGVASLTGERATPVSAVLPSVDGVPGSLAAPRGGSDTWTLLLNGGKDVRTDYSLVIRDLGAEDPGADAATAFALSLGVEVQGLLSTDADVDAYVIELTAGTSYALEWSNTPTVELFAPDGARVYDDLWSNGFRYFTAPTTGRYLLRIRSPIGIYRFTLR